MRDFAYVRVLRGRQKRWEHRGRVESRAMWEEGLGIGWVWVDL